MEDVDLASASDADLARLCQRDLRAFVHLYDRYVDEVYHYCARRLPRQAAEDATSQTFLNAIAAIRALEPERQGRFGPWLFRITRNAVIDQRRRREHDPLDAFDLADPSEPLDERAIGEERRHCLDEALTSLGPEQQRVVRLRLAGMDSAEIGGAIGKSPGAVRVIHHRALVRLRGLLRNEE